MSEQQPSDEAGEAPYAAKSYYRGQAASDYESARRRTAQAEQKWRHEERALRNVLRQLPQASTVLDAPCGTGRFTELFRELHLLSVGVDISADMLRIGRDRDEVRTPLVQADLEQTPFADGSFDYVVSMRLFNLVPQSVAERLLAEFSRISRVGAIVEVRLARDRVWDGSLRRMRHSVGFARSVLRPTRGVQPLVPGRDQLRIHPVSSFVRAVDLAGLRVASAVDVLPNPLGLQPDNLHLVVLRHVD